MSQGMEILAQGCQGRLSKDRCDQRGESGGWRATAAGARRSRGRDTQLLRKGFGHKRDEEVGKNPRLCTIAARLPGPMPRAANWRCVAETRARIASKVMDAAQAP